ncbi:MAG: hypothetical protein CTY20_07890 [Hyphomicrobium sp.]|nr:MAG: hypothetical protein CTY20_07890 [Hyphomicrobium sp.]
MSAQKPTVGQAIDQIATALAGFEGHEQTTILTTVCSLLKIAWPTSGPHNRSQEAPVVSHASAPTASSSYPAGMDIKSLKIAKEPSSAREMACLVAYYLSDLAPPDERKQTISKADIEKYFKQAGYPLPTAMEQVLPDSKKSGYFDSSTRGEYKLTRVGHNQVVHNMGKKDKA